MTQTGTPEAWDAGFDDETVALAYDASKDVPQLFSDWADAIDNKVVATFGVASVLLTIVPIVRDTPRTIGVVLCLGLALGFWVAAVAACYKAYRPIGLRIEPNPRAFLAPSWLTRKPMHFRYGRMQWLGETFDHNKGQLAHKVEWLGYAMILTAVEVFWLALVVIFAPSGGG
jgi:hypothetical protein